MNPLVLYGATGHSLAMRDQIERVFRHEQYRVVAHIDDTIGDRDDLHVEGAPVISFARWRAAFADTPVFVTIGDPKLRRRLVERVAAAGGRFASFVGTWDSIAADFQCGVGSITGAPSYIGPKVKVGNHVQVQAMVALGHDSSVGDFTTICSSNIAGWVIIEEEVFIGIGTTIVHGTEARPIRIGRGAYVCAGSVITKSVPPGAKVIGNPARDMRQLAAERLRGKRP